MVIEQAESTLGGSRCSTHDLGQTRGCVGCGLLGILLLLGLFWSGSWNVLVIEKCQYLRKVQSEISTLGFRARIKRSCLFPGLTVEIYSGERGLADNGAVEEEGPEKTQSGVERQGREQAGEQLSPMLQRRKEGGIGNAYDFRNRVHW